MGEYLTVQDIALRLEVTVDTVRRWLRLGKLKGTSLGRAGYRIDEKDFHLFMHKHDAGIHFVQQSSDSQTADTTGAKKVKLPDLPTINYEQLIQSAIDPIIVRDPMSVIISWNEGARQLYGWSEDEAQGQVTHTLLQTRFPTSREDIDFQLIQHGRWEGVLYHTTKNGRQIVVETRQQLIRDEHNRPQAILEINHDITMMKRHEESLQFLARASHVLNTSLDYEETLTALINLTTSIMADICFVDFLLPDDTLRRLTQSVSSTSQTSSTYIQTQSAGQISSILPSFTDIQHPIIQALKTGQPIVTEYVDDTILRSMSLSDEHYQQILSLGITSSLAIPIIAYGKTLGVLSCCYTSASGRIYTPQDVELGREIASRAAIAVTNAQLYTEQVQARAAEESTQQFVALVENSTDFIGMATLDGITTYINPAGRALVGLDTPEDVLNRPMTDFLPEQLHYYFTDVIYKHIQEHKRWEGDLQIRHSKTGELIDVHQTFFFIMNDQKETPLCMATLARDIREQKELDQRKDTFISMASHELRNPLTTIHANLQLAERRVKSILNPTLHHELPKDVEHATSDAQLMLGRALRQTKVMNRLIGNLLDGTRIQANKLNLSLAEHDIVAILKDTIQDQREVTNLRTIQLDLAESGPILVLVDKDRIGQVISNYLTNALKYSAASEEVTVGIQRKAEEVYVWVKDHGPGLTPEQQLRIWERYYQAKGITVQSGTGIGLGLGLHICKTLITRQGGQVGVDSAPGRGSTFWFTLPLAESLDVNNL
ncbi:PAS domain S-box protein [Ktedonobacteria bacterium brp13]|nr:PAS domain S-box protein [Ktedonobacteria bacterium brp13]